MKRSLFLRTNGGRTIELAVYHVTHSFPDPTRYVSITFNNGERGYLPLDVIGSEYDSGIRYTDEVVNKVYQVCMKTSVNIIGSLMPTKNLMIPCDSMEYVYTALRRIFEERVSMVDGAIRLVAPSVRSGITRVLLVGADLRAATTDIEYSTLMNGNNASPHGGDRHVLGNAVLLKFVSGNTYTLRFANVAVANTPSLVIRPRNTAIDDEIAATGTYVNPHGVDITVRQPTGMPANCMLFGEAIEELPLTVASYRTVIEVTNWCMLYGNALLQTNVNEGLAERVRRVREELLLRNERMMYNFFVLTNESAVIS